MVEAGLDPGQLAPEPAGPQLLTTSQSAQGSVSSTRGSSLERALEGVAPRWLPAADRPAAGVGEGAGHQSWEAGGDSRRGKGVPQRAAWVSVRVESWERAGLGNPPARAGCELWCGVAVRRPPPICARAESREWAPRRAKQHQGI